MTSIKIFVFYSTVVTDPDEDCDEYGLCTGPWTAAQFLCDVDGRHIMLRQEYFPSKEKAMAWAKSSSGSESISIFDPPEKNEKSR